MPLSDLENEKINKMLYKAAIISGKIEIPNPEQKKAELEKITRAIDNLRIKIEAACGK